MLQETVWSESNQLEVQCLVDCAFHLDNLYIAQQDCTSVYHSSTSLYNGSILRCTSLYNGYTILYTSLYYGCIIDPTPSYHGLTSLNHGSVSLYFAPPWICFTLHHSTMPLLHFTSFYLTVLHSTMALLHST